MQVSNHSLKNMRRIDGLHQQKVHVYNYNNKDNHSYALLQAAYLILSRVI
jgi:hypothetical protein